MSRQTPMSTRVDTLFPYPALVRPSEGDYVVPHNRLQRFGWRSACSAARRPCWPGSAAHDDPRPSNSRPHHVQFDPVSAGNWFHQFSGNSHGNRWHGKATVGNQVRHQRSEEHTSELQSLMRISYAVFCLKKKNTRENPKIHNQENTEHN